MSDAEKQLELNQAEASSMVVGGEGKDDLSVPDIIAVEGPDNALPAVSSKPEGVLALISQLAANPNVDPANVSKWLELYERLEDKRREQAYNTALAELQAELPQIDQTGVIPLSGRKVKYSKLEDIDAVIRPMCARYGFAFSFGSSSDDGKLFTISAKLSHREGWAETFHLTVPLDAGPGRSSIQAVASSLSYAKRQLIKMALHIVEKGEDRDGAGGFISKDQVRDLEALIDELGNVNLPKFLAFLQVEKLADIPAHSYTRAVTALEAKRRKGAAK